MQILNQSAGDFTIIWSIAKVMSLVALFIYIVFSFVLLRQVKIMTDTIEVGYENVFKLFSYFHFLFAIAVFIFAFITL